MKSGDNQKHIVDYIDLHTMIETLFKKKWLIILITAIFFILTMFYVTTKPKEYLASTILLIEPNQLSKETPGTNNHRGLRFNVGEESAAAQIALMQSNFILMPLVQSLHLDSQNPAPEVIDKLRRKLLIVNLSNSQENLANKTEIIQITLRGQDPNLIATILNQLVAITQEKSILHQQKQIDVALNFLHQQVTETRHALQQSENKLNTYRASHGKINIQLQSKYLMDHIAELDKQIEEVSLKKINLSQQFTEYHPYMRSLDEKKNELKKRQAQLQQKLKKIPGEDQVNINLSREVEINNSLYLRALDEVNELEFLKTSIVNTIQVLTPAKTPEFSQPIKLLIIGFISLSIGFILGCLIVLSWKIFARQIDNPHWIEKTWGIKNLAVIPYSKTQRRFTKSFTQKKLAYLPLVTNQLHYDFTLNAIMTLRNTIQFHLHQSANPIVTIMGLTNGVGKTFISINLANILAHAGNKVLFIDVDVHHSHIQQYFRNTNLLGLTDILYHEVSIEDAVSESPHFAHLHLLSLGKIDKKRMDLQLSKKLNTLLQSLKNQYQYIIINGTSSVYMNDQILFGIDVGMHHPKMICKAEIEYV